MNILLRVNMFKVGWVVVGLMNWGRNVRKNIVSFGLSVLIRIFDQVILDRFIGVVLLLVKFIGLLFCSVCYVRQRRQVMLVYFMV